jgi:hypothetical protein
LSLGISGHDYTAEAQLEVCWSRNLQVLRRPLGSMRVAADDGGSDGRSVPATLPADAIFTHSPAGMPRHRRMLIDICNPG